MRKLDITVTAFCIVLSLLLLSIEGRATTVQPIVRSIVQPVVTDIFGGQEEKQLMDGNLQINGDDLEIGGEGFTLWAK